MSSQCEASESDLVTRCMSCITNAEVGPEEQSVPDTQPPIANITFRFGASSLQGPSVVGDANSTSDIATMMFRNLSLYRQTRRSLTIRYCG